jgi:hypothetical protein
MRAHIHFDRQGWPQSVNNYLALDGFQQMGWEIVPYTDADPVRNHAPDEIVVGHIAAVRAGLRALGLAVPPELGYPAALLPFLGRRLWQSTINTVAAHPESWPVFVKPMHDAKKFTGVLVRRVGDLVGCGDQYQDTPVWCAEPVQFRAEWRCFVRYGRILDARRLCSRCGRDGGRGDAGSGGQRWLRPRGVWPDAAGVRQIFVGPLGANEQHGGLW